MNFHSEIPLSPQKRAWATRRAVAAIQADREILKAGIETPAPALKTSKPVVDMAVDHHALGCGMRRFVVLDCGDRAVRLFSYSQLTTITVDRLTFDRKARYARDSKRDKLIEILRRNVRQADRINQDATSASDRVPDGGADYAKALQVLQ